jgi:hypothetical protein
MAASAPHKASVSTVEMEVGSLDGTIANPLAVSDGRGSTKIMRRMAEDSDAVLCPDWFMTQCEWCGFVRAHRVPVAPHHANVAHSPTRLPILLPVHL